MLKTKKNELENNFTAIPLSTGKTLDVLNSVVIYGANASGKSNLIKALGVMLRIIDNSFSVHSLFPIGLLIFYQLGFVGCLLDIDTAIHQ
jgi:AAA15 family ATPase/GTPase